MLLFYLLMNRYSKQRRKTFLFIACLCVYRIFISNHKHV